MVRRKMTTIALQPLLQSSDKASKDVLGGSGGFDSGDPQKSSRNYGTHRVKSSEFMSGSM